MSCIETPARKTFEVGSTTSSRVSLDPQGRGEIRGQISCTNGIYYPPAEGLSCSRKTSLMALFHCMVRHGTVRYGSLLGGFPLGTVPGTWYFFSTTSAVVPSVPYRYQNVTCKLCWSLIGRRESSLLRQWTCDMRPIDPLDLNQHSQRRSGRSFCLNKRTVLHQPQMICFVVCWGSSDVPLVDSRGADPVRAWWRDAEGKSHMYILLNLLYFSEYVFCLYFYLCICVLLQLKTIWSNKCTSRLY